MRKLIIILSLLVSFNAVGEIADNKTIIKTYETLFTTTLDAARFCNIKAIYGQHFRYEKEQNTSLKTSLSKGQDNEMIKEIINKAYQTKDSLNPLQYGFSIYDQCMKEYLDKIGTVLDEIQK